MVASMLGEVTNNKQAMIIRIIQMTGKTIHAIKMTKTHLAAPMAVDLIVVVMIAEDQISGGSRSSSSSSSNSSTNSTTERSTSGTDHSGSGLPGRLIF